MTSYDIKTASKLSGVPELSIRAWEGRYSILSPDRTESNRRLYSEPDVEKLILLRKLISRGARIGMLAKLNPAELKDLYEKIDLSDLNGKRTAKKVPGAQVQQSFLKRCSKAILEFNTKEFELILNEASVQFSHPELIDEIILPLIALLGTSWKDGTLKVAHEHFGSVVLRKFLTNLPDGFKIPDTAPLLIATTPVGQYHDLGAVAGTTLAASDGWQVLYLGASLAANEIASVARQLHSSCIFLSIVYPDDDPDLGGQLRSLRGMVGDEVAILINGEAASGYDNVIREIGAQVSTNPEHFRELLHEIRKRTNPNERSIAVPVQQALK